VAAADRIGAVVAARAIGGGGAGRPNETDWSSATKSS
jgi:hypothetical protein